MNRKGQSFRTWHLEAAVENWTESGGRPLVALLGGSDTIATTGRGGAACTAMVGRAACTAVVGRAACTGTGAGVINSSGSGQKERGGGSIGG